MKPASNTQQAEDQDFASLKAKPFLPGRLISEKCNPRDRRHPVRFAVHAGGRSKVLSAEIRLASFGDVLRQSGSAKMPLFSGRFLFRHKAAAGTKSDTSYYSSCCCLFRRKASRIVGSAPHPPGALALTHCLPRRVASGQLHHRNDVASLIAKPARTCLLPESTPKPAVVSTRFITTAVVLSKNRFALHNPATRNRCAI